MTPVAAGSGGFFSANSCGLRWAATVLAGLAGCNWVARYEAGAANDTERVPVDAEVDLFPDQADARPDLGEAGAEQPNLIFISADTLVPGDTSLEQADALCVQEAKAAGREGQFVAWLSDSTRSARERIGDARGFVRPDGLPVTNDLTNTANEFLFYPPTLTAAAEAPDPIPRYVLTATLATGELAEANCEDFTDRSGTLVAGIYGDIGNDFTDGTSPLTICDQALPILCVGVDHQAEVTPEKHSGRLAFVSSPISATDVPEADATCATEAEAANLGGVFRALVSLSSASAASRFELSGDGWVTTRGLRVFDRDADLVSAVPLTGISADAAGQPVRAHTWTGATSPSATDPSLNCLDWTTTAEDEVSYIGRSTSTGFFYVLTTASCSERLRVYCFEQ